MRCKNCGSENDENLYICQNCGSPLYDEDDTPAADSDPTQVFKTVSNNNSGQPIRRNEERLEREREAQKKKQQSIIIIVVLAVLLVAIITGIILAVAKGKSNNVQPSTPTVVSSIDETETERTTKPTTTETTTETTTKETTTEETTTETTTKETTTEKPKTFSVSTSSNNGGETEGDGTYELGETVTVIARPDDGYGFDGWYIGGKKVSSDTSYTFTVTKKVNLKAVFTIENVEPEGEDINNVDDAD